MRILVYTDVHGNKYALEKLQHTRDYKKADIRIFLGDAVSMCPYPNECLDMIFKSNDIFLMGNHDSLYAFDSPYRESMTLNEDKLAHLKYMMQKTLATHKEKIKRLPKSYTINVAGKTLFFTHYMWESDGIIMEDPDGTKTPTIKTAEIFKDIRADYIFFGHNHNPSKFSVKKQKFYCVGSLGIGFPGNYILIETKKNYIRVFRKHVFFDRKQLKKDMKQENYPRAKVYAKWFR